MGAPAFALDCTLSPVSSMAEDFEYLKCPMRCPIPNTKPSINFADDGMSPASPLQLLERRIQNRVFPPVLVVEVPPFRLVNGEALGLHGAAQQLA